jgi:hypothetical protein
MRGEGGKMKLDELNDHDRELAAEQSDRLLQEPQVMTMDTWVGIGLVMVSYFAGIVTMMLLVALR